MNRADLQRLSRLRIREARALLKANEPAGAYYLAGYAVECGLKACVAKKTRRYDFADKRIVNESYTHDLLRLIRAAALNTALESEINSRPQFAVNWAIVKDWSEETRYSLAVSETKAQDLYSAVATGKNGVLAWLRKYW